MEGAQSRAQNEEASGIWPWEEAPRRVRGPLGKKPGPQGRVWVPVHVYQLTTVCCRGDGGHGSGARHPVGSHGPRQLFSTPSVPRKWEQQCFHSCLTALQTPALGVGKGAPWLRTQSVCGKLRAGPWGPKMTEAESLCTLGVRQVQITVMPRGQRQNSTKSQALEAQRKRKDPRGKELHGSWC